METSKPILPDGWREADEDECEAGCCSRGGCADEVAYVDHNDLFVCKKHAAQAIGKAGTLLAHSRAKEGT